MIILAESAAPAAVGIVGLVLLGIFLASLIVAVVWVIFPFIVIGKFNELMKIERDLLAEIQLLRQSPQIKPPPIPPIPPEPPLVK